MEEAIEESNNNVTPLSIENKRKSGVDLLRIIAMVLIVVSHCDGTIKGILTFSLYSIQNTFFIFMTPFAIIGNVLFIICSSYFLVDKTRTRIEKVINILLDSTIISISILCGYLLSGHELETRTIINLIFPDVFAMNWFIPVYVIFYVISPIVVLGLKHLPKKVHFGFVLASLFFWGLLGMFGFGPDSSALFCFIYILNLVAFVKWHLPSFRKNKKANILIFVIGIIIFYGCYYGFKYMAYYNEYYYSFVFTSMTALFIVVPMISLFNLFENMSFYNKTISYLSGCTLFVYVIHENWLISNYGRYKFFIYMISNYGENNAVLYILFCALILGTGSFLLAVIYNETFHRLTRKLAYLINSIINKCFNFIYQKVFKES